MDSGASPRLVDLTVADFVDAVGSERPAPGGGAAAALAGALGVALAEMVAGLTAARERYAAVHDEMAAIRTRGKALKTTLLALVDADAEAYGRVSAAYRLSSETADARAARAAAIEEAMKAATDTPLATAEACGEACLLAGSVAAHGSRSAAGEAIAAALLAHAALRVAAGNVGINLRSIRDEDFRRAVAARTAELLAAGNAALARALAAAQETTVESGVEAGSHIKEERSR